MHTKIIAECENCGGTYNFSCSSSIAKCPHCGFQRRIMVVISNGSIYYKNGEILKNPNPQKIDTRPNSEYITHRDKPQIAQAKKVSSKSPHHKICPNCGEMIISEHDSIQFSCDVCGYTQFKTWEDFGIHGVPKLSSPPLHNPHPQKVFFCELLPPLESTVIISKEAYASNYKGGVRNLLQWIRSGEEEMRAYGYCPAPRPFTDLAIFARKLKEYDLEIAVCERAILLARMHDKIVDKNKFGIRFSQTSINKVIARLPKARELAKKKAEQAVQAKNVLKKTGKNMLLDEQTNAKLEKQCAEHGFCLEYLDIQWDSKQRLYMPAEGIVCKRPEDAVMCVLAQKGFKGTTYEFHPVMMLMQAACAAWLESCAKNFLFEDWRDRTFSVQITQYGLDKGMVLEVIHRASYEKIMQNIQEMLKNDNIRKWFPSLSYEDIQAVLNGLGKQRLELLTDMLFADPAENGKGWPDILAFSSNEELLVEVKTSDSLLDSQIYTWKNLLPKLGINAKVICVRKQAKC